MIFALKSAAACKDQPLPLKPQRDIFCLFPYENSIHIPESDLLFSIGASLKLGHEVLILESSEHDFTELNFSSLWEEGDNWLWIAPRSYRLFTSTYGQMKTSLTSISSHLKTANSK